MIGAPESIVANRRCPVTGRFNPTHGKHKHPMYTRWSDIHKRCYNPQYKQYADYGGRGIRVCGRWHNIDNFIADMGMPPTKDHQIDRRDNNSDYSPENCRWVLAEINNRNRRDCHQITHAGKTQTIAEWSRELGIHPQTLYQRIVRAGDTPPHCFRPPIQPRQV